MGRHSTTLSSSAGTVARVRLKGAAPQVYSGPSQQTQSSFPLWFWAVLLTIALVVFVVSHA
ncbi:hypothetical protein HNQ07_000210 [Deinococcus metalli]|uniref:Uncharacterized protein n=1 Tax=Deinococcus metalli TaxID=1141878 RepID=A0A7W8NMJ6_9DEIO|nr:hypothetical protein [Deinococcus metalli]MBB5374766.1 hypothetical protein [Deinococcus metalli]GHF33876.1 hypothetical protein GCM10017781_08330 [Deinococcus metalli]